MADTWQKLLEPRNRGDHMLVETLLRKDISGTRGTSTATLLASGEGWCVADMLCTAGPRDRPFEERHSSGSVSIVMAGAFVYRGAAGSSLLTAGSLLLGSPGRNYECSHHHGEGDHCLSFQFDEPLFERLARDAHVSVRALRTNHLPPIPSLAGVITRATLARNRNDSWEELAFAVAGAALECASQAPSSRSLRSADWTRVSQVIRRMEASIDSLHPLADLAAEARMSRYHFLRTFKAMTGITPHQWLLRARLRDAARRLATTSTPITTIALDVGFDDLSNFIRSFRAEFGASPSRYRVIV